MVMVLPLSWARHLGCVRLGSHWWTDPPPLPILPCYSPGLQSPAPSISPQTSLSHFAQCRTVCGPRVAVCLEMPLPRAVQALAARPIHPIALTHLHQYARNANAEALAASCAFVHQQLPVRVAHAAHALEQAPAGPHSHWAARVMAALQSLCAEVPSLDPHHEAFVPELEAHATHVAECLDFTRAEDLQMWLRAVATTDAAAYAAWQRALRAVFRAQVVQRLLLWHLQAMRGRLRGDPERARGPTAHVDLRRIAAIAVEDATGLCVAKHGFAPEVAVEVVGGEGEGDGEGDGEGRARPRALFVNAYLHYVMMEVLKNAMHAVAGAEHERDDAPIRVAVCECGGWAGLRVRDAGGGIDPGAVPRAFDFLYTSAPLRDPTYTFSGDFGPPMQGCGVGLPMARLYCELAGGSVRLSSLHGCGTDVTVHLRKDGAALF